MKVLSVQNLTKSFDKDDAAVNDVSLAVEQGELFALVGESGCGKTTLLRLVAGFEEADRGTIAINGDIVTDDGYSLKPEKRKVGMVFQDYALFPHYTVGQNVAFGISGELASYKKQRVKEVLDMVGLHGFDDRYSHNLSGGQQQRVALARALAPKPKLILLDEPFSDLDGLLKDQLREEVRNIIRRAGATALFVTHDMRDALSSADRIAIMRNGDIIQTGTPRELYDNPENLYVANFFGKINALQVRVKDGCFQMASGCIRDVKNYGDGDYLIGIRPENVEILSSCAEKCFKATVKLAQYFGDHQQIHADVGEGKNIVIHAHEKVLFHEGDTICLNFDPVKVHVFQNAEA